MRKTVRTATKGGMGLRKDKHASEKIRTQKRMTRFSLRAHVAAQSVLFTLGSHLPPSVEVLSMGGISSDFRTHHATRSGRCHCHVFGNRVLVPRRHLCTIRVRGPLGLRLVQRNTGEFRNMRSFGPFVTGPRHRVSSAIHRVASFAVDGDKGVVALEMHKGNFLCGRMHDVTNVLVHMNRKRRGPRHVARLLSDTTSHATRIPSTPPRKLAL